MSVFSDHDATMRLLMQYEEAVETSKTDHLQCKRQIKKFAAWCAQNEQVALPASPETIVKYYDHLAKHGASESSVYAFSRAIMGVHSAAGLKHPMSDYSVEKAWLDTFALEKAKQACNLQLKNFDDWCVQKKCISRPATPSSVLQYVRHLARQETAFSDMHDALFAIERAHREAGLESPTSDIRVQKLHKMYYERLLTSMAEKMLFALKKKGDIWAIRDALLISLVYEIGYKFSELAALNVGDVTSESTDNITKDYDMLRTSFPGTKETTYTVMPKHHPLSPVPLLHAWLDAAHISDGPLFRCISQDGRVQDQGISPRSVAAILRRAAKAARLKRAFSAQELYMLIRGGRKIHCKSHKGA